MTKEAGTTLLGAAIIGALVFVGWEIRQNTAALRGADSKDVSDLRGLRLPPDIQRDIDDVFAEYERGTGPGCVVGVVQVGRLTYARGYGIGQMDHAIPLSPTSVFYLASLGKQFTAAAVLIADHEGILSLDEDVREYLPEFPDYGSGVTVRHLLHHTSGVRDYLSLMALAGTPYQNVLTDEAMLALIMRQRELNFDPGSEHLYSNSGYVLLAEIVARASNSSLREYSHSKIFQPLGMTSTHFHDDGSHVVENRVFSYDAGPDGSWRTNYLMNFDKVGDGGLYSSIEDLARWDGAFYDDLLGVPNFAMRMYTRGVLDAGDTIAYARGLSIGERRGLKRVSHGGGFMAFRTMIARYPEQQASVITLCNVGTANSGSLSVAVEDIVMEGDFTEAPRSPRASPSAGAGEQAVVQASESTIAALAGSYESAELGATWVLEAVDADLLLHHPDGRTITLEARSETLFTGRGHQLEFIREAGEVKGFVLGAGRVRNITFDRM